MNNSEIAPHIPALTLSGAGFTVALDSDAERHKAALLTGASKVGVPKNEGEAIFARETLKGIAAFLREIENDRVQVKEPALAITRLIDETAKTFVADLVQAKNRIDAGIQDFAREQHRKQQEAAERACQQAAEARRLADEAEAKRIAAIRAQEKAEAAANRPSPFARAAAEAKAEAAQQAADVAKAEANQVAEQSLQSSIIATAPALKGVKPALDFVMIDPIALAKAGIEYVSIEPRRREILAFLKRQQDAEIPLGLPGIKVKEVFNVSTR